MSQYGAQQLLLDIFEIKTKVLSLHPKNSSFNGIATGMFQKTENLLKVLASPPDRVEENYNELVSDANYQDLEKVLVLMGLKKTDLPWKMFQNNK